AKLAEACASRTHRRHQRCRPPVLKTGTDTGLLTLPHRHESLPPAMARTNRPRRPAQGQYTRHEDEFTSTAAQYPRSLVGERMGMRGRIAREVLSSGVRQGGQKSSGPPRCLFLLGFRRGAGRLSVMMVLHPLFPLGLHGIPFLLLVCIQEFTNLTVGRLVNIHHS